MPRMQLETERYFLYFLYLRAVRDDPEASAGNKRVSSYSGYARLSYSVVLGVFVSLTGWFH